MNPLSQPALLRLKGAAVGGVSALLLVLLSWRAGSRPSVEDVRGDAGWVNSPEEVLFLREMPPHGAALYAIRLDGRQERMILEAPIHEFQIPAGGRKVAYSRPEESRSGVRAPGECGVFDLDTRERVVIATRCWGMLWDPSSRYVKYKPGDDYVYLFDTVTRERRKAESLCTPETPPCEKEDGIVSPSGRWRLRTLEGTLLLAAVSGGPERVILRNTGGYMPDLGELGFERPSWSADERFAVGEYRGKLIVVEIETGRAGVLTRGSRPSAGVSGSGEASPIRAREISPTGGTSRATS